MITKVVITVPLSTVCPNTLAVDENVVSFTWNGSRRINAEALQALADEMEGETIYCEDLANDLAGVFWTRYGSHAMPVTVTVRQLSGHGVEAEAMRS